MMSVILCSAAFACVVFAIKTGVRFWQMSKMTQLQRDVYKLGLRSAPKVDKHGPINSEMACPHCLKRGKVRTKQVTEKKGISGGKATGALLTGGVSLLATGLSRKESATEAYCGTCHNNWTY